MGKLTTQQGIFVQGQTIQFQNAWYDPAPTLDFGRGSSRIYDSGDLHIVTDDNLYLDAPESHFSGDVITANDLYVQGNDINLKGGTNSHPSIYFNQNGSKLYDNSNFHIATDNNLYLDTANSYLSGDLWVQGNDINLKGGTATNLHNPAIYFNQGGSKLYDNADLHIGTDDNLYLDAPTRTYVSGGLTVNGTTHLGSVTATTGTFSSTLTAGGFTGNVTGNLTGNVTGSGTSTLNDLDVTTNIDAATLATTGNTTIGGTLGVTGTLTGTNLKALSTTEQLRLSYNASNYVSFTTDSSGDITIYPNEGTGGIKIIGDSTVPNVILGSNQNSIAIGNYASFIVGGSSIAAWKNTISASAASVLGGG